MSTGHLKVEEAEEAVAAAEVGPATDLKTSTALTIRMTALPASLQEAVSTEVVAEARKAPMIALQEAVALATTTVTGQLVTANVPTSLLSLTTVVV